MSTSLGKSKIKPKGVVFDITEGPQDPNEPLPADLNEVDAPTLIQHAMRKLAIETSLEFVLVTVSKHVVSDACSTACVALTPGGQVELHINEAHIRELGPEQYVFILAHEAYHLLLAHLNAGKQYRSDPLYQIACEAIINHRVHKHTRRDLPVGADGKKTGVDWRTLYNDYRRQVEDPVTQEKFLESDVACMNYLRQMPKPPKVKTHFCSHVSAEAGGVPTDLPKIGDGLDEEGEGSTIDENEAGGVVGEVLSVLLEDALNGDEDTAKVLQELEISMPDTKVWGNLGLGRLRGEKVTTRKTSFWENSLRRVLGSQLMPGYRLAYNRKLPLHPMLFPCGKEPHKKARVYTDSSGSMHQPVLERLRAIMVDVPNVQLTYNWFDACVYSDDGENIIGGGGTSFAPIMDDVAKCDEEPDAIIVITDGYAPHIEPNRKGDWIWVIVPGGDPWPRDKGMETIVVDDMDMVDGGDGI